MAVAATYSLQAQDIHSLSLGNVSVDGNPDEWPQPFRYYEGTTKLQFAFANDTGSLYVCIKVTDAQTQLRLFNSGLNICVDPKGKKKETVILSFPLKPEGDPGEGSGSGQKHRHQGGGGEGGPDQGMQKTDLLRLKHHARTQQLALRVKGFAGIPEQVLPLENAYHIAAAFDWDSLDILTVEYKLPLALILGHTLSATDTIKPIAIGFIEPAPEVPHATGGVPDGDKGAGDVSSNNSGMNNHGMGGGMNGGGMGGMGGGGMGGGRGGGMGHSMQETNPATQEQKVWSKVFLKWTATNKY